MCSLTDVSFKAIALNFQKNASLTNVMTNDAYNTIANSFCIVSMYTFCLLEDQYSICVLKLQKKLFRFFMILCTIFYMKRLKPWYCFCDLVGGQNKNTSVFKCINYLVQLRQTLISLKITFANRGHLYLTVTIILALSICRGNYG